MTRSFFAAVVGFMAIVLGSAPSSAQMAYITGGDGITVIDTATNTVVRTIPLPSFGVAVSPDGSRVYVANGAQGGISMIDTATNTVTATIPRVEPFSDPNPLGIAISPDGSTVYAGNVVIDTATNTVIDTIPLGNVSTIPIGPLPYRGYFPFAHVFPYSRRSGQPGRQQGLYHEPGLCQRRVLLCAGLCVGDRHRDQDGA
jgi:YVTN family beta-propeller protein